MKIERIKKCIEWDRLEFEVFRPVYLENKYLKIDKDSKTIFIKDGIFAYEKECCIESKELHTIVSDIDKMNIKKWKDIYSWDGRSIDGIHWKICLYRNSQKVIEKIGHGVYPGKLRIIMGIYEMLMQADSCKCT